MWGLINMERKIRILHIAQAAGGVDRYLKTLLKYLNKEKYENIVVFSQSFDRKDYEELVDEYEVVEMYRAISFKDIRAVREIRKQIKNYSPDIIYAHSSKAGALARIADIGLKNYCIYNPHGWAFNMKISAKKRMFYTVIERLAAPFCEKIVCISEAEKHAALNRNICKSKQLQVIYNGIDIEAYKQYHSTITRKKLGILEDANVVGMVGRVSRQKAPDIFIRAAKKIKEIIPNSYFIIVGNGEMENEIRQYAKENGLESSLLITGWVKNPLDYIQIFDVAMLLSRWEGFGLVLPEYMLSNKPIIATDCDAIPYIVEDGVNGLLVSVDNPDSVVKAMLKIYSDPQLKQKLIENGNRIVRQKFDAKRMARETEQLFAEVMKGSSRLTKEKHLISDLGEDKII